MIQRTKILKTPLIILCVMLLFGQDYIYSQCVADAGKDTILCIQPSEDIDSLMIGGEPTATGSSSFTYEWSAHETYLSYDFYASDLLSDTTSPNPYFFIDPGLKKVELYLKVIDQEGGECFDTLVIRSSHATYLIIDRYAYIEPGDSVQLYPSIGGGIEPTTFSWSPTTSLSNPNIPYPYASPTVNTGYKATLTDSLGCKFIEQDVFQVYVDVADLSSAENPPFTAFFDYSLNKIKIKNPNNRPYKYSIYNSSGVLVAQDETNNTEIVCEKLSRGMYYFVAFSGNTSQQYLLKFIVN